MKEEEREAAWWRLERVVAVADSCRLRALLKHPGSSDSSWLGAGIDRTLFVLLFPLHTKRQKDLQRCLREGENRENIESKWQTELSW